MHALSVLDDTMESEYCVLSGLVGSDDQLCRLRTFLGSSWFPNQKKWLIDNRTVPQRPTLDQIMQLLELVTQFHEKIDDLVVAWVAKGPCMVSFGLLEEVLPFHFERFEDLDEAHAWLIRQEVYDPSAGAPSSTRYRDERLGPEVGFTSRPFIPQTHVEAEPDLMLAPGWAIAHEGEDAKGALSARDRRALAARVAEAIAEADDE